MSEEILNGETNEENETSVQAKEEDGGVRSIRHLSGMFERWFLDYASYVILERAVPYVNDGLKPVQRRILHSMREMDDGRYNKVANIIGNTMKYHPHGDASIGDALVQLGQKNLLVDCQGNWGNILTGDDAAAPRYIEARLSKFALEVVFNPKTTQWKLSYDGRNREPVTLPVKFPLLLAQGVEGIAVGLASKILPHNFNELLEACVACLRGEDFVLYPDFPTGGMIDVSKYNDGLRGGVVKIRARIEKDAGNKILRITEIPFGRTTGSLIDSILKANEKGKIKIKKIDDNTAANVEILVHLAPGVSSDKTIDALYACTDCELSVSPNSCVIENDKPVFMPVSEILRRSVAETVRLLMEELRIRLGELEADWQYSSLERIFIEKRIYKDKAFEESATMEEAIAHVRKRLEPFVAGLIREVTDDDIRQLLEIRMKRILKFNSEQAEAHIRGVEEEMQKVKYDMDHIVDYAIHYYESIRERYGKGRERLTEIRGFESIEATKVVVANEKLYINRADGFIGTSLKKDEYVCNCSDIDDIIIFYRNGTYKVVKVSEKMFVGKDILYLNVFKRNDNRTIYNVVYRDGKAGYNYIKRFAVTGVTRDKEYTVTKGTEGSRILYFSANSNGEAETVKIILKPKPRQKLLVFEKDFSTIAIKGRSSMGNILTKADIHKVTLKQKGSSTLGGRMVWFDRDVLRLNYDGRGEELGEFQSNDQIMVILQNGDFYTTNFDLSNHYESTILNIEKFDSNKVWTAALYDADQQYGYLKRFQLEASNRKQNFLGENEKSFLYLLTDEMYPRIEIIFGGHDAFREALLIDADEFVGVKGFKAKGKRVTTHSIDTVNELEPTRFPTTKDISDNNNSDEENNTDGQQSSSDLLDEITGQMKIFDNNAP